METTGQTLTKRDDTTVSQSGIGGAPGIRPGLDSCLLMSQMAMHSTEVYMKMMEMQVSEGRELRDRNKSLAREVLAVQVWRFEKR